MIYLKIWVSLLHPSRVRFHIVQPSFSTLLNDFTFNGNRIQLVHATDDHVKGLQRILNDPATTAELPGVSRLPAGWSLDEVREHVHGWKRRREAAQSLHLVVLCAKTGKVVGWCGFNEIVRQHRRAEFGIVLEASFWGRGAGLEGMFACYEFGFETLMLHRMDLNALETNTRSVKLVTRGGAVPEGIKRDYVFHNQRFINIACFSVLEHEWPAAKQRLQELLAR